LNHNLIIGFIIKINGIKIIISGKDKLILYDIYQFFLTKI